MRFGRGWLWLTLGLVLASTAPGRAAPRPAPVSVIHLTGAVDVPSSAYLARAVDLAEKNGSQALVVLLDTPGGAVAPMTEMTKTILNAPLPVIVYVYPAGGYAMSAGTFITMSAHVAAMQPNTSIGAAHPISLLGGEPAPAKKGEAPGAVEQKLENAFAEQARVIAEARGRNTEWAANAVRQSKTATAREAVTLHVVDLLADDLPDLLRKLDGRQVILASKHTVTLHTAGARTVELDATVTERFLHVLADPNMLLILLALAGMGIMFELQNPGAILPGVVGGISLLLALYSMSVLSVNYAGVALIIFGLLLFLAEIKVTSHGVLTVGGIISFVMGALMLTNVALTPTLQVSGLVLATVTVLVAGFFLFVIGAGVRAHLRKVQTGAEGMVRTKGRALDRLAPSGEVMVEGERWRAKAVDGVIEPGEEIEVVAEEKLTLLVQKVPNQTP